MSLSFSLQSVRLCMLGWAALLFLGCGSTPGKPVYGTIAGAEGKNGFLVMVPAAGGAGPSAQTMIEGGKFRFNAAAGPWAGDHLARVQLTPAEGETPAASTNIKEVPVNSAFRENPLQLSEFEVAVKVPEQAPYQLDFAIPAAK